MRNVLSTLTLSTFCTASALAAVGNTDWPQWRGPSRDGHLQGFKTPAVWPRTLVKRWSAAAGEAFGSPIVVANKAYILVRQGEQEVTLCLDLATGRKIWEDRVAAPFNSVIFPAQRFGKSPRSTPLYHSGRLYTVGVNGLLTCFTADTGKVLWRRDFAKMYRTPMPICGASLSPLVDGKKLYIHAGHDNEGAFFALDRDTGKEIWAWKGEGPGYTSPIIATLGGVRQIVTASHNMWLGLDPNTGAQLWNIAVRQNMFNHNSISSVVAGDLVICGGNQRTTFALRIQKQGSRLTAVKAWETRDVTLSTASPVVVGTRLYALNEKRRGQVVVMDTATGRVLWGCGGSKGEHATFYDAGPNLLHFRDTGELVVYRKNGDVLDEVSRYQVAEGMSWGSPAISGNRFLVKGAEILNFWEIPSA